MSFFESPRDMIPPSQNSSAGGQPLITKHAPFTNKISRVPVPPLPYGPILSPNLIDRAIAHLSVANYKIGLNSGIC
jgi:hypothetical protein